MAYTYTAGEYRKCLLEYNELDRIAFTPNDKKEFVIEKLEERSAGKRRISAVTDTIIREYIEKYEKDPESLCEEDARKLEELFAGLHDPKTNRALDLGIAIRVSEILKDYYKRACRTHDYLRKLKDCVMNDRMLKYNHSPVACASPYIDECMLLSEKFDGLPDEDKLQLFIVFYWIFINHEDDNSPEDRTHSVDQLMSADEFLCEHLGRRYDEFLEKAGALGIAQNSLSTIMEHFLWSARHHIKPDIERIRPFLERYADILRTHMETVAGKSFHKISLQSTLLHADYQLGKITLEELLDAHTRMQADVKEDDDPVIQATKLGEINYHYLLFLHLFSGYGKEKVVEMSQQRVKEALPRILKITREVNNPRFNLYLMFFILGASFTSRFENFSNLLLEMTVYSDKALYVHTEMVKEISLVLFDHLIEYTPDCFDGVAGRDTGYIKAHKREMRRLLSECCKFHDIGKFFMLDIVENSMRRLTDNEFAIIRTHPTAFVEFGRDWMEQDEDLQCIRDCAMTHHLWHDGTKGYPGIAHTKNRPFADILAIADSIDAATDYIGRPYHSDKTLDQLIDEIKSESGTRYGPDATAALSAPEVRDRLLYLTTEGRKDINYRIYAFNKM